MQLQKLVFLAQGYALATLGHCLFERNIHAWQWGPVIPSLYKSLQKYGAGKVTESLDASDFIGESSEEYGVISAVWQAYGGYTGSQLSDITHRTGSPWSRTWERKQFDSIPVDEIKDYYCKLVAAD